MGYEDINNKTDTLEIKDNIKKSNSIDNKMYLIITFINKYN